MIMRLRGRHIGGWRRRMLWLAAGGALLGWVEVRAAEEFLEPEVAFRLSAEPSAGDRIDLRFRIAPGYYLYRQMFRVSAEPASVALGRPALPPGKVKFDETFQKDVETYRDAVVLSVPLPRRPAAPFKLVVGNQGCADRGLCYPPMARAFKVEPEVDGGLRLSPLSEAEAAAWSPDRGKGDASTPASAIRR